MVGFLNLFSLWNLRFFAIDPPQVLNSLRFLYGWVSQPFLTVEPQVFCHGPSSSVEFTEMSFFPYVLLFFFGCFSLFFYMKSAKMLAFYVNSSHVICIYYLCLIMYV